jgi:hypothetical protein
MSSKINLQTCEYARKSSIFQDNQLIFKKYGKTNTKEYLAKKKDISYNEDEVQKSQIPSGLCG